MDFKKMMLDEKSMSVQDFIKKNQKYIDALHCKNVGR